VRGKTLSNWRESLHAAAVTNGGERSWILEAVSLSTTIIGPPHLGQDQKSLGPSVEASCSVCGARPSSWKESGKVVASGGSYYVEDPDSNHPSWNDYEAKRSSSHIEFYSLHLAAEVGHKDITQFLLSQAARKKDRKQQ
jgi:hypothetical protein